MGVFGFGLLFGCLSLFFHNQDTLEKRLSQNDILKGNEILMDAVTASCI